MNGYLMQEQNFRRGEDCFLESFSPENNYGVVFEDDGETGYFYAVEKDPGGHGLRVLDALHIYEADSDEEQGQTAPPSSKLLIVWSKDWKKCALIINGACHALFDFETQGGYNINEFPPPNDFWTKGERKLTDELVKLYF
jgi:hypothetical protein